MVDDNFQEWPTWDSRNVPEGRTPLPLGSSIATGLGLTEPFGFSTLSGLGLTWPRGFCTASGRGLI